jgi:hypothetical protein
MLPLRWGTHGTRLWGGLWLIIGGGAAIAGSDTYVLLLLLAGSVASVVGWCILPAAGWRRVLAVGPATLAMWLLLPGPRYLVVLLIPYLAWLLVRHRPPLAWLTAIPVLAGALVLGQLYSAYEDMLAAAAFEFAIMVGSAWAARLIAARRTRGS